MKTLELNTPLNYKIVLSKFSSENSNAVVVICSATGVLQGYYSKFATFLQENGFTVYTFDYGGIGYSKKAPLKNFKATLSDWATNDIETVLKKVKEWHPSKKINFFGHSLGGQLLSLVPSNTIINSSVLVASQTNYFSFWNGTFEKARVFTNWFIIFPFFTTFWSYFPSKRFTKMEDLPLNVANEFSFWARQKNYYFNAKPKNEIYQHQLRNNITIYSCNNDKFAPKEAIDWLGDTFTNATVKRKHLLSKDYNVKNIGHFGFFKSKFKETIWQEFLQDLQA